MRLWWIDEPKVMGSSNPTTEDLKELHGKGFHTVFSLLDENEQRPNYAPEQIESLGMKRYSIQVRDYTAPTLELFEDFLEKMEQALVDGSVLIHCQGGSGRTGTMASAYWIHKGLSADEAIKKVRQSKPGAIETTVQEESLRQLERHLKSS